jgi:hypothetical protein
MSNMIDGTGGTGQEILVGTAMDTIKDDGVLAIEGRAGHDGGHRHALRSATIAGQCFLLAISSATCSELKAFKRILLLFAISAWPWLPTTELGSSRMHLEVLIYYAYHVEGPFSSILRTQEQLQFLIRKLFIPVLPL